MEKSIAQLEQELRNAKAKESEEKWSKKVSEIESYIRMIRGLDLCRIGLDNKKNIDFIVIFRIRDIQYDQFWGSNKKLPKILCTALTMGSKYFPGEFKDYYSTNSGHTVGDKHLIHKMTDRIELPECRYNGFPLGVKKVYNKEFNRIIDTGTLEFANSSFIFGKEENTADSYDDMARAFMNFKYGLYTLPKDIFDRVEKMYIKQCVETHDLLSSIKLDDLKKLVE